MIAAHGGDKNQVDLHLKKNEQISGYIDSKSKENKTALHYASAMGHVEVVHLLIQHKADVDMAGCAQMAALHFAAFSGHTEVVIALLDAGAAINASMNNRSYYSNECRGQCPYGTGTALYLAAKQGHVRTAQLLIERKAFVNGLYQVFVLQKTSFSSPKQAEAGFFFRTAP